LNPEATYTFFMKESFKHPLVGKLSGMNNVTVVPPKSE
jgi:7-cyano-7-deazaguanine tRNA-ribosyltransferase